ncbi:hypothetical protein IPG36_06330 [bacterium]|nr:MAG: hypothetical protein IPG36_06330 [bacterium]
MTTQLHELILKLQSGYTFRGPVLHDPAGDVRVAQSKDVTAVGVELESLPRVTGADYRTAPETGMVVLLAARGSFRAAALNCDEPIIASSSLYIMKPDESRLLPEYLAIHLNSPAAQAYFAQNSTGSSIKTLLIDTLRQLPVPDIPLDRQALYVALHQNLMRQRAILERKTALSQSILNQSLTAIEGAIK